MCVNKAHARPWELVTLEPIASNDVVQEPEEADPNWIAESDDNSLAAECQVGDHFAIMADTENPDDDGAEFYVLLCTKPMYVHHGESIRDAWNAVVDDGDEVLEGYYYRQRGRRPNSYVLLQDAGVARVYSHLVCTTKFRMTQAPHKPKGNVTVFHLSDQTLEHIAVVLQTRREHEELNLRDDDYSDFEGSEDGGSATDSSDDGDDTL